MRRRTFCQTGAATLAHVAWPASAATSAAVNGDIPAVTGAGKAIVLKSADVARLRAAVGGSLLLRGDTEYDAVRQVWNAAIDRKPALIARCRKPADVIASVKFARERDLLVAVRCGGHSSSGKSVCDDGLMIDLATLRGVSVDRGARIARVAGGSLLGDVDDATIPLGLATTTGTVSHTGVGGLTLGGGMGHLGRAFGLTIDNLVAADVVTADGEARRASASENPDLFWGLRGGGGNFGVVTSFEFSLHPFSGELAVAEMVYPMPQARAALKFLAEYGPTIPDATTITPAVIATPGGPILAFGAHHVGSPAELETVLQPLRKAAPPVNDAKISVTPYLSHQKRFDRITARRLRGYLKSGFVKTLGDDFIDALLASIAEPSTPLGQAIILPQVGGAISRVAPDATAFPHRNAAHAVLFDLTWEDAAQGDAIVTWARATWRRLEPSMGGVYVNFTSGEDAQERLREAYGENYPRLVALKKKYDPTNLFRLNVNVSPDSRAGSSG
jgi:FAD/FMN-containing dehydrogenase